MPDEFDPMLEELLAAGRRVNRLRLEGDAAMEREVLQFMDGLWDRMPHSLRLRAETAFRDAGLDDLAALIVEGRKDIPPA